jgi:hypothetical protein
MRLLEVPVSRPFAQEELNGASLIIRNELKADVVMMQFKGATFVRLSAHGYNDASQYERLVDIPQVLAGY